MRGAAGSPVAWLAATLLLGARAGAAQATGHGADPWHGFAGIELGQPLDAVVALGASCQPALGPSEPGRGFTPAAVAQLVFGFALPHPHRDTAAVRAALADATVCTLSVLGERAQALVLGVARTVAAVTVWFNGGQDTLSTDSLRSSLRRAWRGGSFSPRLDSWYGRRYRAFYLITPVPPGAPPGVVARPRLILVDIAACSAFERRVHRQRGSGPAEPC